MGYQDSRQTIWERQQIEKAAEDAGPRPSKCPKCGYGKLHSHEGYVGEEILVCEMCNEIVWEDSGDAVARVI
jgi:uncharacterized protein (DUF983 family)